MPYKLIKNQIGVADEKGVTTKMYMQDEVIEDNEEWKKKLGERLMAAGYAMFIEPDVVVPMHKNDDSLPSDVEPLPEPPTKLKIRLKESKARKQKK